ncbi:Leupaxin [Choanephora cucurbitarum]|uniref:Leupaxin n=1 Tax=Choanephora cucurbitarum TaxID=101091 RepID=A0A1C7NCA3_9FUNG|nr:Leupaxin [Choanephora cucurbitarum]
MVTVGKPSLVECPLCQSSMRIQQLASHVCLYSQPAYRFSQVSHYETDHPPSFQDIYLPTKQTRVTSPLLSLTQIIEKKKAELKRWASNRKNRCSRCFRYDAPIHMAEKYYHAKCFSCFYCRTPLLSSNARLIPRVHQGQIYCSQHYPIAVNQPTCASCHCTIPSSVRPTMALGHYFHPEHLRCHHCRKPVDPFMTGIREAKVEKEAVVSRDGKLKGKWHKQCFRCQACHVQFPDNQFYIYNNQPYCKLDYHKLNNTLCHSCSLPVEGECAVTSEGWRFHPDCFVCH